MSLVLGWWLFIAFVWSFFCWARYTDRNAAPIERRIRAALLGLAWPYAVVRFAYDRYAAGRADRGSVSPKAGRFGVSSGAQPVGHLPTTSYGYSPPSGATQHGWTCTNTRTCGTSEHEAVRGWPLPCPSCGSPTDPLFDEPWAHAAEGIRLQHILRADPDADGGFHGDRWPVWQLKDAFRHDDEPAIAAARRAITERADGRQLEAWWGPGSIYFHVIWTELEFNRLDDAATDLLEWLGRSSSANTETDNTTRTNCRQVIDMSAKFLAAPGGASHPKAADIRRGCVELAAECYQVLNTEQQAQITAMARA